LTGRECVSDGHVLLAHRWVERVRLWRDTSVLFWVTAALPPSLFTRAESAGQTHSQTLLRDKCSLHFQCDKTRHVYECDPVSLPQQYSAKYHVNITPDNTIDSKRKANTHIILQCGSTFSVTHVLDTEAYCIHLKKKNLLCFFELTS